MSTAIESGAAAVPNQQAAAAPLTPVIELQSLSVRFGSREILKNLICSLRGRAIGLLGPNGAGKSTLINTLLGFYKPSFGSARLLGHDIRTDTRRIRSLVGYMPENDAFISKMSAVSFVQMMGELSGLPPSMALERAHEALFYVGLAEARYSKLGTYSLGMKQLIKLAQALGRSDLADNPLFKTNALRNQHQEALKAEIIAVFDGQMDVFSTSARVLDDGVIDPRDTRAVLAEVLAICREAEARHPQAMQFSVARP